jgi:glycosyltransferase involved in cell wall biosynthesis
MTTIVPESAKQHSSSPDAATRRLCRVLSVLALDPTRKFGSLEEQALILAREFKMRGGTYVPAFTRPLDARGAADYAQAGVSAEALDLDRLNGAGLRRLLAVLRTHRIEVMHWHFYHPLNPYLWLVTIFAPWVRHFRTDHSSRAWNNVFTTGAFRTVVRRSLLRRYQKVLCVSGYVLRCCEQEAVWSGLSRCDHFVNTDRFRPDAAARARVRSQLGVDDSFVVLAVAHLIPEKGVDLAIRAVRNLPQNAQLWVVGDGADRSRLRSLSAELGLERRVLFLGSQRDVAPFMQAADCLVCPSLWAEAAGLVNLEALASGLPVVASAVGGIPEHIDDGKTGFLFRRGDEDELTERIGRLHNDRALAQRLGRGARASALERFSIARRLDEFLDVYRVNTGGDR